MTTEKNKKSKYSLGFSLIETALYLAIVGTAMYYVGGFAVNSVVGKNKVQSIQDVNQVARSVMDQISSTVESAVEINSISSQWTN